MCITQAIRCLLFDDDDLDLLFKICGLKLSLGLGLGFIYHKYVLPLSNYDSIPSSLHFIVLHILPSPSTTSNALYEL